MARAPRSLHGKVVVVTGGGRGIGEATARAAAARGARVAIGDLDAASAERVAASLPTEGLGLALDVTDRPGFTEFLDLVEAGLGPLDVVVNNAGIMPVRHFDTEEDESIVRQVELNLLGVIHGTREAARRMRPRGSGHIVNIASAAGKTGFPGLATYCATKHGVVGYSEAVRGELHGSGLEISVVMPVVVRTELAAGIGEARGVKSVQVEDVADAIVDTLERPRFDVFVPRSVGVLNAVLTLLPRRAREGFGRLLGSDHLILDAAGSPERAAYEARAAASAPAAATSDAQPTPSQSAIQEPISAP